jgi:tetratricopeptide (TPR) repeat protein
MIPNSSARHCWVTGPDTSQTPPASQAPHGAAGWLPPVLADVDGHSRLRGPFTAAGALLRAIGWDLVTRLPELARKYDVEILSAAPELRAVLECSRDTLTSEASPASRTRYYPHIRATRIGYGLTELITGYVASLDGPRTVVVRNAEHAEPTDLSWLADMLRRTDAALLRVVVCSASVAVPDPLGSALRHHAQRTTEPAGSKPTDETARPHRTAKRDQAAAYVTSDCTSHDPALRAAYLALPTRQRALLHDARATELESRGEVTLRLGSIPYHRERGSDPAVAGAAALSEALQHCLLHGFYDAVLDLGQRCHAVLNWTTHPEDCWLATVKMAIAYSAMGRADDAMRLYDDACANTTLPSVHMQSAYGRAMLYTRYYEPERRDHRKAKAWVNTAIALSALSPDEKRAAYNLTFNENGLALIEMHLGEAAEALRLVEAGIKRLDTELGPQEHALHRSVLKYNRAQLIAKIGPLDEAIAAYTDVITEDPNHNDYYFERAALFRKAGRSAEALADYAGAARTSPPYPEPYYNRGDLLLELGDLSGALADFDYVLELDPEYVDAYVNRAAARYQLGEVADAAADVSAGLDRDPREPHLLCLRGLLAQEAGDKERARQDFLAALDIDAELPGAWANLGVLAFEQGDTDEALRCFNRSLELTDDPAVRENLAVALQHSRSATAV